MISRIKSIYFSIRGFYYRNLTPSTLYYRTKYGILNLIIWFPIIWRDRNWDHSYMFEMLEYKLSLMEKLFRKYGHSVNSEKDAHYIMICKNLCKRLADDEYTNPYEERNRLHHEWFSRKFEEAMNKEPNKIDDTNRMSLMIDGYFLHMNMKNILRIKIWNYFVD